MTARAGRARRRRLARRLRYRRRLKRSGHQRGTRSCDAGGLSGRFSDRHGIHRYALVKARGLRHQGEWNGIRFNQESTRILIAQEEIDFGWCRTLSVTDH